MSRNSTMQRYRSLDLLAMDLLPQCPTCDELCNPGATVCGECGQRLVPVSPSVTRRARHDADCPCTVCTIIRYDEGRAL